MLHPIRLAKRLFILAVVATVVLSVLGPQMISG